LKIWDDVSKRQKTLIEEKKEDAVLSKELVTIKTDVDIETGLEKFQYNGFDDEKLRQIFQELEFKNLLRELGDEDSSGNDSENRNADESTVSYDNYQLILSEDHLDSVIAKIKETGELSIDLETTFSKSYARKHCGCSALPMPT